MRASATSSQPYNTRERPYGHFQWLQVFSTSALWLSLRGRPIRVSFNYCVVSLNLRPYFGAPGLYTDILLFLALTLISKETVQF